MKERLALSILQAAGMHGRPRIKKVLLLRRQQLQIEIAFREGEMKGLQAAIAYAASAASGEAA
jgi:hypothetical protein